MNSTIVVKVAINNTDKERAVGSINYELGVRGNTWMKIIILVTLINTLNKLNQSTN